MSMLAVLTAVIALAGGSPDLVVSRVEAYDAASIPPGSKLGIPAAVRNKGARRARASRARFYLSEDRRRGDDVALASATSVDPLRAGRRDAFRASVRVPASTKNGSYYVLACADSSRRVAERREGNNCRASDGRVTIRRPIPPGPR
jgi:subtilase family serine protease